MSTELNPWFASKLEERGITDSNPGQMLRMIVQVEYAKMETVQSELRRISNVSITSKAFDYIGIIAPAEVIDQITQVDGVVRVSYDMPVKVLSLPSFPMVDERLLTRIDPLVGEVGISRIEMPNIAPDLLLPLSPFRLLQNSRNRFIPTSETKAALLDVPTSLRGSGVRVAVLDTGVLDFHPMMRMKSKSFGTDMFPIPQDDNGHGMWCCSTVAGDPWTGPYGVAEGIAPEAELLSIKVLGYGLGMGTTMSVLQGMWKAYTEGAKIISMSLGGDECQGGCYEADGGPCPQCRAVKALTAAGVIFSVAAGNSGPGDWTIGCPGCSPDAITVGAWSMTDDMLSWFSSRGPQNKANEGKAVETKPDVASYGGGRGVEAEMDELLYSGCCALLDGMNSGLKHFMEGLKGTSMATPHFSGLLALAVEAGKVQNAADVKAILADKGHIKTKEDGWGLARLSWFT